MMRRILLLGVVIGVAVASTLACQLAHAQVSTDIAGLRRTADIELPADSHIIAGLVRPGSLGAMLASFDLHDADRQSLVVAMQQVFDVRRLRVGQPFVVDRMLDGRVRSFEYEIDGDRRLRVAADAAHAFAASIETIDKDITVEAVEGRISRETPSLTQALDAAGERIDLALQMADVFSGELDFSSELQPGDEFRLVIERQMRDGAFVGYGAILAAEFVASGRALRAYRFALTATRPPAPSRPTSTSRAAR
jgi:hypothetical protein